MHFSAPQKNSFNIGSMYVDIFLPGEQVVNKIIKPNQCHGKKIVEIISGYEDLQGCDALITKNSKFKIGVITADCAPICFSNKNKIGIAHVGWRGLCAGIIPEMLKQFDTHDLMVYVAPFMHSFQIKRDFCYEEITNKFGSKFISEYDDKLIFNFKDTIASLLPEKTIFDERDTFKDLTFPSYRRMKTADRFITSVYLKTNTVGRTIQ